MAQTGKKINELTQISTVTNETVLPGVYVNSGVADSTASKISVQQLSAKVQNDMSGTLAGKQDTLTAGDNITIESNVISATDTKYTAGANITISEQNVISSNIDPSQIVYKDNIPYATADKVGGIKQSFDASTGTWTIITEDL